MILMSESISVSLFRQTIVAAIPRRHLSKASPSPVARVVTALKHYGFAMSIYPKPEQLLPPENMESSSDRRLQGGGAPIKSSWESLSGNTDLSNRDRGSGVALGDTIAKRLSTLIEDCIQQVTSSKQLGINGSSDGMSDRLQHSQKRASLHKDVLEAEREAVHQAACEVINALNDVHHTGHQL